MSDWLNAGRLQHLTSQRPTEQRRATHSRSCRGGRVVLCAVKTVIPWLGCHGNSVSRVCHVPLQRVIREAGGWRGGGGGGGGLLLHAYLHLNSPVRIKQTAVLSVERLHNHVWFENSDTEGWFKMNRELLYWARSNTLPWLRTLVSCCSVVSVTLWARQRCASCFEVAFILQMSQMQLSRFSSCV